MENTRQSSQTNIFYCAIVIDAGSTESRLLVIAFKKRSLKKNILVNMFLKRQGRTLLY